MGLVERIVDRLQREKERMEAECSQPPCLHAQGIGLAIEWVKDEANSASKPRKKAPPFSTRNRSKARR